VMQQRFKNGIGGGLVGHTLSKLSRSADLARVVGQSRNAEAPSGSTGHVGRQKAQRVDPCVCTERRNRRGSNRASL
jgi:hypothetical protein